MEEEKKTGLPLLERGAPVASGAGAPVVQPNKSQEAWPALQALEVAEVGPALGAVLEVEESGAVVS